MTRITCACSNGHEANAQADVPTRLAETVGKATHGLVYDAHNPSPLGAIMRRNLGIVPVK
jgi:hypothetical protein